MCKYYSFTWFFRVIGGDERIEIGRRGGKDGVYVGIGGKGKIGRNSEGIELMLQMGDKTNAFLGSLDDINKNCSEEFRKHWRCLDNNNQQLWHCRRLEQLLNGCVFDKLVRLLPPISTPQEGRRLCISCATGFRKEDPRLTGGRDTSTPTQDTDILAQHIEYTGG